MSHNYIIHMKNGELYHSQLGYICHHGVEGQKWGVRNGPPYPINDNQKIATDIFKKAIKNNYSSWGKDSEHNTLFVSGISGSGKTTLSNYLATKNKAEVIHLDKYFGISAHDTNNKIFDRHLKSKFGGNPLKGIRHLSGRDRDKALDAFASSIKSFGKALYDNDKRLIVEGIDLFNTDLLCSDQYYKNKPMIICRVSKQVANKRVKNRDKNV